jgi:hypothetical protein
VHTAHPVQVSLHQLVTERLPESRKVLLDGHGAAPDEPVHPAAEIVPPLLDALWLVDGGFPGDFGECLGIPSVNGVE